MRAILLGIALVAATMLPTAQAWALPDSSVEPTLEAAPFAPRLGILGLPGQDAVASAGTAISCALGDINADDAADLLIRTVDASGKVSIKALAGPDFTTVLWTKATAATTVLQCAADLDADGLADPVVRLVGAASSQVPGGAGAVAEGSTQVVLQTLAGASGAVQVSRMVTESATQAGQAGVAAGSQAAAQLLPAAQGAVALVQTQTQGSVEAALAGLPVPLPVGGLGAALTSSASLQVLDAAGRVVGTVAVDTPGVTPLALAAIPAGGLPAIASLTVTATGAVGGAAAQVPELSLFNADGSLAWATKLAASTGATSLIPRVGDLNADGVADLAIQTATGATDQVNAAKVTVVSGLDGAILFTTETAGKAATLLPLGPVQDATALLLATAAPGDKAAIALSAIDGAGKALWSAQIPAGSFPANLALDAHTAEVVGFTDLTGDLIPDVAFATALNGSLSLSVIDGLSGNVAWTTSVEGAESVLAVPRQVAGSLPAVAGPVLATAAGQATDLVAVGTSAALTISKVSGVDGQLIWTLQDTAATGLAAAIQSAGDLDADGVADLLLTTVPAAAAGASAQAGANAKLAGEAQVRALSTETGVALTANASVDGTLAAALSLLEGPAYPLVEEKAREAAQAAPGAGLAAVAVLALAAFAARRRVA